VSHNYPPGEQARWNELERRILLADVDIKRLWKALPQEGITSPRFDGLPVEPVVGGNVLVVSGSGATNLLGIHNTAFSGTDFYAVRCAAVDPTPTEALDLELYDLIYISLATSGAVAIPSWIAGNIPTWINSKKQRRLFVASGVDDTDTFLASCGVSMTMTTTPLTSNGPADPNLYPPNAHYLSSGHTFSVQPGGYRRPAGGTTLYESTMATNPINNGALMQIASTSIGSEVVLLWSFNPFLITPHVTTNAPFARRLYPSADYGGMLIP